MIKDIGTLAEIDAQVGDVVECTANGWQGTIEYERGGFYKAVGLVGGLSSEPYWRIISRANQGPVREVTTVRKEIVPGRYNGIVVGDINDAGIYIDLQWVRYSAAELTAAITTLTAIRDAMADSSGDTTTAQAR